MKYLMLLLTVVLYTHAVLPSSLQNDLDSVTNASCDEYKRIYRKLALKYHPDKQNGSDADFKLLNETYEKKDKLCNSSNATDQNNQEDAKNNAKEWFNDEIHNRRLTKAIKNYWNDTMTNTKMNAWDYVLQEDIDKINAIVNNRMFDSEELKKLVLELADTLKPNTTQSSTDNTSSSAYNNNAQQSAGEQLAKDWWNQNQMMFENIPVDKVGSILRTVNNRNDLEIIINRISTLQKKQITAFPAEANFESIKQNVQETINFHITNWLHNQIFFTEVKNFIVRRFDQVKLHEYDIITIENCPIKYIIETDVFLYNKPYNLLEQRLQEIVPDIIQDVRKNYYNTFMYYEIIAKNINELVSARLKTRPNDTLDEITTFIISQLDLPNSTKIGENPFNQLIKLLKLKIQKVYTDITAANRAQSKISSAEEEQRQNIQQEQQQEFEQLFAQMKQNLQDVKNKQARAKLEKILQQQKDSLIDEEQQRQNINKEQEQDFADMYQQFKSELEKTKINQKSRENLEKQQQELLEKQYLDTAKSIQSEQQQEFDQLFQQMQESLQNIKNKQARENLANLAQQQKASLVNEEEFGRDTMTKKQNDELQSIRDQFNSELAKAKINQKSREKLELLQKELRENIQDEQADEIDNILTQMQQELQTIRNKATRTKLNNLLQQEQQIIAQHESSLRGELQEEQAYDFNHLYEQFQSELNEAQINESIRKQLEEQQQEILRQQQQFVRSEIENAFKLTLLL